MTREPNELLRGLWQLIPDHLATAAADVAGDLDAAQVARLAGATTAQAQAAVDRAVTARRLRRAADPGPLTWPEFLAVDDPHRRAGRPPVRWDGLAVRCPRRPAHRIGAVALRYAPDWSLGLENAGRDAQDYFEHGIADATPGKAEAARERGRVRQGEYRLLITAAARTWLTAGNSGPSERLAAERLLTAVDEAERAVTERDVDAVVGAIRGTLRDPILRALPYEHPLIGQLSRYEDAAAVAAGWHQPWTWADPTDTLRFRCPAATCRFDTKRRVGGPSGVLALYARAQQRGTPHMVIPAS